MSSNDLRAVARTAITAVGYYFGGPIGGAIAGMASNMLLPNEMPDQHREGPRLSDLKVTGSSYGKMIPIIYKGMRLGGNIVWSKPIQETSNTVVSEAPGGKGGGGGGDVSTTTYSYSASFFVVFSEGPGTAVGRIWLNGKLAYDNRLNASAESKLTSMAGVARMTFYNGAATQVPDALMVAHDGDAPAYRGVSGILFERMQLADYGNRIPNVEAEIFHTFSVIDEQTAIAGVDGRTAAAITDDGMLIAVQDASPLDGTFETLALLNPFTGAVIKKWSSMAGFGLNTTLSKTSPAMTSRGDVLLINGQGYVFWGERTGFPALVGGMIQAQFGIGEGTNSSTVRPMKDEHGTLIGACTLDDNVAHVLFRILPSAFSESGVLSDSIAYLAYLSGPPRAAWYNYDGKVTLAYECGPGIAQAITEYRVHQVAGGIEGGVMLTSPLRTVKISDLSGTKPVGAIRDICVAGDGSVFLLDLGDNCNLFRVDPSWTTCAKLTNYTANAVYQTYTLTKDWSTGDILNPHFPNVARWKADGTFVKDYLAPSGDGGFHLSSNPNFPRYLFTSNPITGAPYLYYISDSVANPTSETLAAVIQDVCVRCGLQTTDIDVSTVTGTIDGFVISSQMTGRAALQHLMDAYFLDAVETNGKIKFVQRGSASVATITEVDLGESQGGGGGDYDAITREADLELPREVAVTYADVNANYEINSQFDRRLTGSATGKVALQLPMALSADRAKQIAGTLLYSSWVNRTRHQFSTSRKYMHLEPGDVVTLSINSVSTTVRLTAVRDQGTRLQFEAIEDDSSIYSMASVGGQGPAPISTVAFSGPTNLLLLDIALVDGNDTYGIYLAGGGYVSGWPGAKIFSSSDGGTSYVDSGKAFTSACTIGTCTTTLSPNTIQNVFDNSQTVTVVLSSGSLSSVTELQGLAGANTCLIGEEVITFLTATLVATNTYTLSTLFRGRVGTSWASKMHRGNERFVLLSSDALRSMSLTSADVGKDVFYKAVTFGGNLAQSGSQSLTLYANRLKPVAPAHVGGGRNAAGDIIMNWKRSARGSAEWRDLVDLQLDEATESYEVDLFGGSTTTITSISAAANGLVTTSGAHGRAVNDMIFITGVSGMTNINDRAQTIVDVPSATTFKIGENTSGYTAGTGGVYRLRRAGGAVTTSTPTYTYTAAQQTTDFGSAQSPAYYAIQQMSARVGRGHAAYGQI